MDAIEPYSARFANESSSQRDSPRETETKPKIREVSRFYVEDDVRGFMSDTALLTETTEQ